MLIHRISRKKYNIFALDIESHNDEESIAKNETSMWLGCFINDESKIDDESSYFYSWDELFSKLNYLTLTHRTRKNYVLGARNISNICIYIYNASFEWSFILPYLLSNGYKFKESIEEDDEKVFSSITTKSVSSVWEARIKIGKKNGIILIRDLAKLYGGGLEAMAKAFNLDTQKGEIDYTKNRLHYKDKNGNEIPYIPTRDEKEYCFNDTRIIVEVLLKTIQNNDKDFFNSLSMAGYSVKQLLKAGYPRSYYPYKEFRKDYPALSEKESDFIRKGFAGGLCYAVEDYQFKEVKKVLHIDAKQMYPSMIYLYPHPYGEGEYFTGKPTAIFKSASMCHVRISYTKALLHSVIALIGIPFIDDLELWLWDFEIPLMYKIYKGLKIEYIEGYTYKLKFLPWRKQVKRNFDLREEAKKKGDSYNVLRYKLLNNSGAYGKFVERPHNLIFKNYINEDNIIDSLVEEKSEIKINAKYTYIPLCSITARARVCLIETALLFGIENLLYFDTDSIFCLYNDHTKKVYDTKINKKNELGGWAIEEISDRAQFTASKRYKLEIGDKTIIKAGGINFDKYKLENHKQEYEDLLNQGYSSRDALREINIPFDEVSIISSKWAVQRAYRCKGGTLIKFQEKEMSIPKKYIEIYKNNVDNN